MRGATVLEGGIDTPLQIVPAAGNRARVQMRGAGMLERGISLGNQHHLQFQEHASERLLLQREGPVLARQLVLPADIGRFFAIGTGVERGPECRNGGMTAWAGVKEKTVVPGTQEDQFQPPVHTSIDLLFL